METKIGRVVTVDQTGTSGTFVENGTNAIINFEIVKPDVYVVPGDAVKVVTKTRSGNILYKYARRTSIWPYIIWPSLYGQAGIVIEINRNPV